MRAANPLDVDDVWNPSHEDIQNRATLDLAEEHHSGDELQGHEREDGDVGECCQRVMTNLFEGLTAPECRFWTGEGMGVG